MKVRNDIFDNKNFIYSLVLISVYLLLYKFPYITFFSIDFIPFLNVREFFIAITSLSWFPIVLVFITNILFFNIIRFFTKKAVIKTNTIKHDHKEFNYNNDDNLDIRLILDFSNPFLYSNKTIGLRE